MVTRLEVAKLAGVSESTVSRVINESGYVSRDVKVRVLQSIKELNYVPNRIARSLRMQESKQIACVTQSITNSFYSEIVTGIEEIALTNDFTFSLFQVNRKKSDFLKMALEGFYDGIIILSPFEVMRIIDLEEIHKSLPTVMYWDRELPTTIPHVFIDLKEAMRNLVRYLICQGHKEIILLSYKFNEPWENPRYQGYVEAMKEYGIPIKPYYMVFVEELHDTLTVGHQLMTKFLNEGHSFSAVVGSNDLLALGAMRAIMERGKRVPDDISVVGIDDVELSNIFLPSLTTIQIPKRLIGQTLMKQLLSFINRKEDMPQSITFDTNLIERESVKGLVIQDYS